MIFADWVEAVLKEDPLAKIIVETGNGETYGEIGDVIAVIGPDMQADVVGVYGRDICTYWSVGEFKEVSFK